VSYSGHFLRKVKNGIKYFFNSLKMYWNFKEGF
jgi:hypothetical protein